MMRCLAAGENNNTPAGVRNDASPAVSVISGDYSVMNEAIKGLQTEYVVFLENGACLCDNALSRLLKGVRGVGMVFCGYESPSEESPETVRRVLSSPDMACRLFFRLHDESMMSNKLFRTSIIKKHGLFFEPSFKSECSCAFLASYLMYCKNAIRAAPCTSSIWCFAKNVPSAMNVSPGTGAASRTPIVQMIA